MNEVDGNKNNMIIYNTEDGKTAVSLYSKDGSIWMNQNQISELFDTSKQNISLHINNVIKEGELSQESVVKDYLTTASDGKKYKITFYSLEMILAIGFRVRSKRGVQFRKWANQNLKEYMVKGFIMDDERLKQIKHFGKDYFDEMLDFHTNQQNASAFCILKILFFYKIKNIFQILIKC